jgi:hypothetical protein
MKINQDNKEKQQNSCKVSSTYKVKDENIKKMHEYLKKQNNGNS